MSMSMQGRELLGKVQWRQGLDYWPCAERTSGQRSAPACPVCLHARNLSAMQMSVLLVGYDRRGSAERLQQTGLAKSCMLWLHVRLATRPHEC